MLDKELYCTNSIYVMVLDLVRFLPVPIYVYWTAGVILIVLFMLLVINISGCRRN